MNVREARTIVLLSGSHTITAGYGIHEIFRRPTISIPARVGLLRDSQPGDAATPSAAASSSSSSPYPPDYSQYLVGAALDDAERRGQPLAIFWPMRRGAIRDWQQLIALWRHVLFHLLPVKRSANDSYILVSLPSPLSRSDYTHLTQVFFEHFNAPAICIVEKPLLAAYGVGTMSACVVDLGWEACDVTPVVDCQLLAGANVKTAVGARHCILFLAHLLRRDSSIVKALDALLAYKRKNAAEAAAAAAASATGQDQHEVQLQRALVSLATQLVEDGHALDDEAVMSGAAGLSGAGAGEGADGDEGNFDIATALVEGPKKAQMDAEEERRRAALEAANEDDGLDEAVIASITGEEGQAGGSTDEKAVLVHFRGLNLKVGPERFRFLEPLFRPELLDGVKGVEDGADGMGDEPFGAGPFVGPATSVEGVGINGASSSSSHDAYIPPAPAVRRGGAGAGWGETPSLPTAIASSIARVEDLDRRVLLWENLILTGSPARVKTIQIETISALSDYVASAGTESAQVMGEPNALQPRNVRALRVPDYFSEFKDRTDLAAFLGGTVYAKLVFGDMQAKGYITKQNYNELGPNAAYSVRASV